MAGLAQGLPGAASISAPISGPGTASPTAPVAPIGGPTGAAAPPGGAAPRAAAASTAPTGPAMGGDMGDEDPPNVSPEEQAAYDAFVTDGLELIYAGGKVRPGIVRLLDEDPSDLIAVLGDSEAFDNFSPVVALAATAVILALQVVKASKKKPAGEIVLHGGKELIEELADMSAKTGLRRYSQDDLNRALLVAMDLYRMTAGAEGLIDRKALTEDFDEIVRADRQGRAAELLPGIERFGSTSERFTA